MAKKKEKTEGIETPTTSQAPEDQIVRANVHRQVERSQAFVSLYANDTQVQLSPWDIRLIFGVISDPPSEQRPTILVSAVGEVRMSPQHAKKVALILLQQLKLYESSIGPIPLPD